MIFYWFLFILVAVSTTLAVAMAIDAHRFRRRQMEDIRKQFEKGVRGLAGEDVWGEDE